MGLMSLLMLLPYAGLMIVLVNNSTRQNKHTAAKASDVFTRFSIIIPFRNEANNIERLLSALKQQKYPQSAFELIFINDQSTDHGPELLLELLDNCPLDAQLSHTYGTSLSPKKTAITLGISLICHPWIITIDADTTMGPNWLNAFNDLITGQQPDFIAGPVRLIGKHSLLFAIQNIEFSALQLLTQYSFQNNPILCNGANLAFKHDVFKALEGYKGNEHIASGDDVFLLRKVAQSQKYQAVYLSDDRGLVYTESTERWSALWHQRMRWASKTSAIRSWRLSAIALLILSTNLYLIFLFIMTISGMVSWPIMVTNFLFKLVFDLILLQRPKAQNPSMTTLLYILCGSLIYPPFIMTLALLSPRGRYVWKARRF